MVFLVQENRTGLFKKCGGGGTKGREKMEVWVCVCGYFMKNKEEKRSFIVIST